MGVVPLRCLKGKPKGCCRVLISNFEAKSSWILVPRGNKNLTQVTLEKVGGRNLLVCRFRSLTQKTIKKVMGPSGPMCQLAPRNARERRPRRNDPLASWENKSPDPSNAHPSCGPLKRPATNSSGSEKTVPVLRAQQSKPLGRGKTKALGVLRKGLRGRITLRPKASCASPGASWPPGGAASGGRAIARSPTQQRRQRFGSCLQHPRGGGLGLQAVSTCLCYAIHV